MQRCPWCGEDSLYVAYHDTEWGSPLRDEGKHFEFLVLETQQAGLSWRCILGKREAFRRAYADFDPSKVARFTAARVEKLLEDPGIIRNRRKVEATVKNAQAFLRVAEEFGSFDSYLWRFVDGRPVVNEWRRLSEVPTTTALSDALSADLKARGFSFVGSTIVYAHMQAIGMVNDHLVDCFRWKEISGKKRPRASLQAKKECR
jgi:DNA-3-methyladenine glycosylase I